MYLFVHEKIRIEEEKYKKMREFRDSLEDISCDIQENDELSEILDNLQNAIDAFLGNPDIEVF